MIRCVSLFALALIACKPAPPTLVEPDVDRFFVQRGSLEGAQALAAREDGTLWVALEQAFARRAPGEEAFSFVARGDLPVGQVTFLGSIQGSRNWLFAYVHGKGFFRAWEESGVWTPIEGLTSPLLEVLRPGLRPVPMAIDTSEDGVTWLATIGGLYFTSDEGVTWDRADTSSSGDTNIVFTDVDASRGRVAAVSLLPEGLIPEQFDGILSGRVFVSENSGLTWSTPDEAFPSDHPTSVALAEDGFLYVGTMDEGLVRGDDNGNWTPLFGPSDVSFLDSDDGGLSVGSATRGIWRLEEDEWTSAGNGPTVGLANGLGLTFDGSVYELIEGEGEPPPAPAEGTVHVALSFSGNYHRSTRGDTPDEDGFGQDIRILTSTLNWLDENGVRADWVFENARTVEERMPLHSPELLTRIRARIANGTDDVRLSTYTGLPTASISEDEYRIAIGRAQDSTTESLGPYVPGLHPSESMLSGDNFGWFNDTGVDWITLFYGANGFTGNRNHAQLDGAAAHNPYRLTDPDTLSGITVVPVYHHGDLLDHGGLEGWVKQLSQDHAEDTLLVVHFAADAESWENFGQELADVVDLPFVRFTTINDYIATHDALQEFPIRGDIANGVGDGFSSWSEKTHNQQVWTRIERARHFERAARELELDTETENLVDAAMTPRLNALAVNNFGLTAPLLHPTRVETSLAEATAAETAAREAWNAAKALEPLGPQELEVINPLDANARVTVPFQIKLPEGAWEGEAGLTVERGLALMPIRAEFVGVVDGQDIIDVEVDIVVAPHSQTPLVWGYDPGDDRHIRGTLTPADRPQDFLQQRPFVECPDGRRVATGGIIATTTGPFALRNSEIEEWELPTCLAGSSTIRRRLTRRSGWTGTVVEVEGTLSQEMDAGGILSVALMPITCPSGIESLRWKSYGGEIRSREIPDERLAWNPVSADGWYEATCGDGSMVQIAIAQFESSSMASLTLRNTDEEGLLVPLGTLWGEPPYHDGRRTGGTGVAELVTPLIGSQFSPSAPEWAGKTVSYRIWLTSNTNPDELELFAKPPLVRSPQFQ